MKQKISEFKYIISAIDTTIAKQFPDRIIWLFDRIEELEKAHEQIKENNAYRDIQIVTLNRIIAMPYEGDSQ